MPTQRLIALNGNAGAFVNILATVTPSRILMVEDDAATRTGFSESNLLDKFATVNSHAVAANILSEPIAIPDINVGYEHFQKNLGLPVGAMSDLRGNRPADTLVSARGLGAGATTLRFSEYE